MIEVGAFEAKTHLSALLERVSGGEEVLITRRGKAIARLVSAQQNEQAQKAKTIHNLLSLRQGVTLQEADWKALRDTGRR